MSCHSFHHLHFLAGQMKVCKYSSPVRLMFTSRYATIPSCTGEAGKQRFRILSFIKVYDHVFIIVNNFNARRFKL